MTKPRTVVRYTTHTTEGERAKLIILPGQEDPGIDGAREMFHQTATPRKRYALDAEITREVFHN